MGPAARPGWRVSVKGKLRLGLQGFNTTCKHPLSDQGRQGYRLSYDGIGFVKVSEAQVSVKEKFFQGGKASYKAKSSD
jgi:hypothetical protein